MNTTLDRLVLKLDPKPKGDDEPEGSFKEFLDKDHIILLGDPGSGKSYLFNDAVNQDIDALFFSARAFSFVAGEQISGKTVYIDGLDETRSNSTDADALGNIVSKILQHKPAKVRLSCRSQDWLGEGDLSLLKPYIWDGDNYCVLQLQKLTESEQFNILNSLGVEDPNSFLSEAKRKGVRGFLSNPQTLIMLANVVTDTSWPSSKFELYERATNILLNEHSDLHKRTTPIQLSTDQKSDIAGAVMATQLIANEPNINLHDSESDTQRPSITIAPIEDLAATRYVIRTKAFEIVDNDTISYSHRTIAEFLAARWLSKQVDAGLPFTRLLNVISYNGAPATELRGLYAWLSVFLPSKAISLIKCDPYGILQYGDVSNFTTGQKCFLLESLVELSNTDPYFRERKDSNEEFGALSDTSLEEQLISILADSEANFDLKTMVLDALFHGQVLPNLVEPLGQLFTSRSQPLMIRLKSFEALKQWRCHSQTKLLGLVREVLFREGEEPRLAANLIVNHFGLGFTENDIGKMAQNYLTTEHEIAFGEFWGLDEVLPANLIEPVITKVSEVLENSAKVDDEEVQGFSEVQHFQQQTLLRYLNSGQTDCEILWKALKAVSRTQNYYSTRKHDGISSYLSNNQSITRSLFHLAWAEYDGESIWRFWSEFPQILCGLDNQKSLLPVIYELLKSNDISLPPVKDLFELGMTLSFNFSHEEMFGKLYELGRNSRVSDDFLVSIRSSPLTDWRAEEARREVLRAEEVETKRLKTTSEFDAQIDKIISGQHFGWMRWLGNVYWGRFEGSSWEVGAIERLNREIGVERTLTAIEGLERFVQSTIEPMSVVQIAEMNAENKYYEWWYAVQAGISILLAKNDDLSALDDKLLEYSLGIDFYHSIWARHGNENTIHKLPWLQRLNEVREGFVFDKIHKIAKTELANDALRLSSIEQFRKYDSAKYATMPFLFSVVQSYPSCNMEVVRFSIKIMLGVDAGVNLLGDLALDLISCKKHLGDLRDDWYAIAFLTKFDDVSKKVQSRLRRQKNNDLLWRIRSFCSEFKYSGQSGLNALSCDQVEFLVINFSKYFPNLYRPSGTTMGDMNPWDASDFVKSCIAELSSRASEPATESLHRLALIDECESYIDHLKHNLSQQLVRRRQAERPQSNWQEVTQVLKNDVPINHPDLIALIYSQLESIEYEMRNNNRDVYKQFWNEDKYSKVTNPKTEESGRDVLLDQLNMVLKPLNILAEPEGHMAQDKRSDILISVGSKLRLPVEIKRHYHSELWTACEEQLAKLYSRDPLSDGYGIYLIFWYGVDNKRQIPTPPKGMKKPNTAKELQEALATIVSLKNREKLLVKVIDVTAVVD